MSADTRCGGPRERQLWVEAEHRAPSADGNVAYLEQDALIIARLKDMCERAMHLASIAAPRDDGELRLLRAHLAKVPDRVNPTVPMILCCPSCRSRHIDKGEHATKPHHTHACQCCGFVWRPAVAYTFGVQFLPGFKDEA